MPDGYDFKKEQQPFEQGFEDEYHPDFEFEGNSKLFGNTMRNHKRPPDLNIELISELPMVTSQEVHINGNKPLSPFHLLVPTNPESNKPREAHVLPSPINIQTLSPLAGSDHYHYINFAPTLMSSFNNVLKKEQNSHDAQ